MDNIRFIKASYNEKLGVAEYIADNGDRLLRSGGTIAWRFNNPGNLRPGAKYKLQIGQGKTASGVFLIFPTPEAGREEKRQLLLRKYKDDSISRMLYTYAPPKENDTEAYINTVCKKTGFSRDRVIGELSSDELTKLMHAMEEYEGYHHKKETRKEQWLRTTTVGFSDGARPIIDLPVKVKRNQNETVVKTNAYGQLPPLIHLESDETVELCVKGGQAQWQTLEPIMLGGQSKALLFANDLTTIRGITDLHNPPASAATLTVATRYVVQPGDTLSKIASRFKVEVSKLQKDNRIKDANRLMPGQVLSICREKDSTNAKVDQHPAPKHTTYGDTKPTLPTRSKDGKGHPLGLIPFVQKRAPWMEFAVAEAKRWHGQKENEITKESNYHALLKTGRKTLVGNSNPWCASFVNWCLKQAGYVPTSAPASSQSFRHDKNYTRIDKPIYGAIAVYTDTHNSAKGHVGFLYALTPNGSPIILGGNQSDTIDFESAFGKKLSGYYVPLSYLEFAKKEMSDGPSLIISTAVELNQSFGIKIQKKKANATL